MLYSFKEAIYNHIYNFLIPDSKTDIAFTVRSGKVQKQKYTSENILKKKILPGVAPSPPEYHCCNSGAIPNGTDCQLCCYGKCMYIC